MALALILVSLLALAEAAVILLVNAARRHWQDHDKTLKRQLAFDEQQLDELLGPRRSPDVDDPTRRVG